MGKILDFLLVNGDWKDYRSVRALREGEQLAKKMREDLENKDFEIEKLKKELKEKK